MSATAKRVTAGVLIIGDEILSGRTQDVNLNAIAKFLADYGIDVIEARVVGDMSDAIVEALNALRARCTYVFTTGGIGPTHDDITADCVAEAFGVPLYEDDEILEMIQKLAPLNDARRRMARLPEGASKVANGNGPPGFQIGNVFVLAGVPSIARRMLEDIGGRLEGGDKVISRTLRTSGAGEGLLAAPLEAVALRHPDLSLGSYPYFSATGSGVNLVIRGRDAAQVMATVDELIEALREAGVKDIERVEPKA